MATKHGLGRGLGALLRDGIAADAAPAERKPGPGVTTLPADQIRANPHQPRQDFEETALAELAASIREHGVLQPLIVRGTGNGFELIAGERRLRAARKAELAEVPVVVVNAGDQQAVELALVENVQREDLNVLEEAEAYQALMDRFSLTQEQVAERVGKPRASVANALRLLRLPDPVKAMVRDGRLSAGHAKLIGGLDIEAEQVQMAERAVKEALSVRALEKLIAGSRRAPRKPRAFRADIPAGHLSYLSDRLHAHFGTSVRLQPCKTLANGKKVPGTIEISYFSNDDLDRILSVLGVTEE